MATDRVPAMAGIVSACAVAMATARPRSAHRDASRPYVLTMIVTSQRVCYRKDGGRAARDRMKVLNICQKVEKYRLRGILAQSTAGTPPQPVTSYRVTAPGTEYLGVV